MLSVREEDLPGQVVCTIVWTNRVRAAKLSAKNTFSFELAMSASCWWSTYSPMPREYTCTFLYFSRLDATLGSVYGPLSVVCLPSVITIAICKREYSPSDIPANITKETWVWTQRKEIAKVLSGIVSVSAALSFAVYVPLRKESWREEHGLLSRTAAVSRAYERYDGRYDEENVLWIS